MGCMPYPGLNNTEVMNFLHIGGRLVAPHSCPQPLLSSIFSSRWEGRISVNIAFTLLAHGVVYSS